ncbi:hypothetical protein NDU88_005524 [Pleurodeles waltl]|uniref:Uncharacterized protein n=1 Tax=Pleurodeles waltl TaxID=8319 RepID=A0AAV7MY70_PLEWA|nr:hypothetical protein NDU88_005524 [Pleurodeles waltl]
MRSDPDSLQPPRARSPAARFCTASPPFLGSCGLDTGGAVGAGRRQEHTRRSRTPPPPARLSLISAPDLRCRAEALATAPEDWR